MKRLVVLEIEQGDADGFKAIVLHRTDVSSVESALNQWKTDKLGTHFIIDKDGSIHQIASLNKTTYHIGPIKMKNKEEKK